MVENECILMLHGCKVVTRVQITNTTRMLSKFRLSRCTLLRSNNVFFRAMWCNNPLKIFQRLQIALALRARGILLSLKNLLVLIKTKWHVVTYTNIKVLFAQCDYFQIIYNTQPERPENLKPSRWMIVSLNLINERGGNIIVSQLVEENMLILEGIFAAFCGLLYRLDWTKDPKAWLPNSS